MTASADLDAEVGVIGVGSMGSMALWQTTARGVSAIGFEQFRIGHELGAGAGEGRQFRDRFLEEDVRGIMAEARDEYRRLEADSGRVLLTIAGSLTIGRPDSSLISELLARMAAEGYRPRVMGRREMSERYPQHVLAEDEVAIWDPEAGFVRPELSVVAASASALRRGARVEEGVTVTAIEPRADSVVIRSADRAWRVRRVVVTTGAWTWRLLGAAKPRGADLGRLLLTWFPTRNDDLFTVERHPVFTRVVAPGVTMYGLPSQWAGTARVGLAGPRSRFGDPDELDRVFVPAGEVRTVVNFVSRCMPDLEPTVIRTGTYLDAYTPDGQPIIGTVGDTGNVIVAAGFSGRGFKMAPVVGGILADLAIGQRSHLDIRRWSPDRFAP